MSYTTWKMGAPGCSTHNSRRRKVKTVYVLECKAPEGALVEVAQEWCSDVTCLCIRRDCALAWVLQRLSRSRELKGFGQHNETRRRDRRKHTSEGELSPWDVAVSLGPELAGVSDPERAFILVLPRRVRPFCFCFCTPTPRLNTSLGFRVVNPNAGSVRSRMRSGLRALLSFRDGGKGALRLSSWL